MKITRLFMLMLLLTASAMASQPGGGSFGSLLPGEDAIGGSNSTMCEWYWIDCGLDGIDDWCCGSFNSCWAYCEEFCGATCYPYAD